MTVFRYDKSWDGLLTAIYDAYSRHEFPEKLLGADDATPMFADGVHEVASDSGRAMRVWQGLRRRMGRRACNMLLHAWLSEEPWVDELLFRFMCKVFSRREGIESDFADPDVLAVHKIALKVAREGEHVRQFLRFQKAADGSYFAPIAPKYNALPLAIEYLTDRFADQRWLVYDTARHYGYYFDTRQVKEVFMEEDAHLVEGRLGADIVAGDEVLFQQAWRGYLGALTIRERLNPRLQRQHMPRRFWNYMNER